MKSYCYITLGMFLLSWVVIQTGGCTRSGGTIDRHKVVSRHNPQVTGLDSLSSLSVGNGGFAYTVDITGLQTFPERYVKGVPLGTQSQWGWHSYPNTSGYKLEETFSLYDFGRGNIESYPVIYSEKGRQKEAANYLRNNAHRLHLGMIGFEITDASHKIITPEEISSVNQSLDLWTGTVCSRFVAQGQPVKVSTVCHPDKDMIAASVSSPLCNSGALKVRFKFPYGTGNSSACDWDSPEKHQTRIIGQGRNFIAFERTLDTTKYYVNVTWEGKAMIEKKEEHYYLLSPQSSDFSFSVLFSEIQSNDAPNEKYSRIAGKSKEYWKDYWRNGGFIDLGEVPDVRANELERRIILSQYLTAIQCAGKTPPQETGLTYNSWNGKFHLEMHWWHAVHFVFWNRSALMERSFDWYAKVAPKAKETAERQHFKGIRWMKMTDLSGNESPSAIGPFLIWQQPHYIYMAELMYRRQPTTETLEKYKELVFETAEFMASFATLDEASNRYVLKGILSVPECGKPSELLNPPFELAYWNWGLSVAQRWRERAGLKRNEQWDDVINRLSPLPSKDGLYLAVESAPEAYTTPRSIWTTGHPSVLGVYGVLPEYGSLDKKTMRQTFDWIWNNWDWNDTWGWDFPMIAMCAARLGLPEKAVDALLMDVQKNTYLLNGHNYHQNGLFCLSGNGGLLAAVAMMAAGWDGSEGNAPGFPKSWNVKYENMSKMP
jgi:hypothetical protein